jgi:hypothetical protein
MRAPTRGGGVMLNKAPVATETWEAGPGKTVNLGPAFFADTPRGQLDRLLTAIARATRDVSSAYKTGRS